MSLQDWVNSRPKGVSFDQFHADGGKPYRSERHARLGYESAGIAPNEYPRASDPEPFGGCICSLGLPRCSCTQACERAEESPLKWGDLVFALCLVLAFVLFVCSGPMVQNFLRGMQ